jgi:hypothetical protein
MGGRWGNAVSHLVAGKRRSRESLRETKAVRISEGYTSPQGCASRWAEASFPQQARQEAQARRPWLRQIRWCRAWMSRTAARVPDAGSRSIVRGSGKTPGPTAYGSTTDPSPAPHLHQREPFQTILDVSRGRGRQCENIWFSDRFGEKKENQISLGTRKSGSGRSTCSLGVMQELEACSNASSAPPISRRTKYFEKRQWP